MKLTLEEIKTRLTRIQATSPITERQRRAKAAITKCRTAETLIEQAALSLEWLERFPESSPS